MTAIAKILLVALRRSSHPIVRRLSMAAPFETTVAVFAAKLVAASLASLISVRHRLPKGV